MGRFFLLFGIGLTAVIAILLTVPSFVDWNSYRDAIQASASRSIGREVKISGPIAFAALPKPALSLSKVEVAGYTDETALLTLDRLDAQIATGPLLTGKVRVTDFVLNDAKLDLVRREDGTGNWQRTVNGEIEDTQGAAVEDRNWVLRAIRDVRFDNLSVKNLKLAISDEATGERANYTIEWAKASFDSLDGPFAGEGRVLFGDVPLFLKANVGRLNTGRAVPVLFDGYGSQASDVVRLEGRYLRGDEGGEFNGKLNIQAGDLRDLIAYIAAPFQMDVSARGIPSLKTKITLDAEVAADGGQYALREGNLAVGDNSAKFNLDGSLGDDARIDIGITSTKTDLDTLLTGLDFEPSSVEASGEHKVNGPVIAVRAESEGVSWKNKISRDVALTFENAGPGWEMVSAGALLPGKTVLSFERFGEGSGKIQGNLALKSENGGRSLLSWLGFDVGRFSKRAFNKIDLKSKLSLTSKAVAFSEIDARIDRIKVKGAAVKALAKRPSFGVNLEIGNLDLTRSGELKGTELEAFLNEFDGNAKLKLTNFKGYGAERATINIDGGLKRGQLTLKNFAMWNGDGGQVLLNGKTSSIDMKKATADIRWDVRGVAVCRVIQAHVPFAEELCPEKGRFAKGRLRTEGGKGNSTVKATIETLELDGKFTGVEAIWNGGSMGVDVSGEYEGVKYFALGNVGRENGRTMWNVDFGADGFDAAALLTRFELPFHYPAKEIVPLTASGKMETDGARLRVNELALGIGGATMAGHFDWVRQKNGDSLTADLKVSHLSFPDAVLQERRKGKMRWVTRSFPIGGLERLNADLKLMGEKVSFGDLALEDFTLKGEVKRGEVKLPEIAFRSLGGAWSGSASSKVKSNRLDLTLALDGQGVDLETLSYWASGLKGIDGKGNVQFGFAGKGDTAYSLVSKGSGGLNVQASSGQWSGFDISGFSNGLDEQTGARSARQSSRKLEGGKTPFENFELTSKFDGGVVRVSKMKAKVPTGIMDGQGYFDLTARILRGSAEFTFDDERGLPNIAVSASGQVGKVVADWDIEALAGELDTRMPKVIPQEGAAAEGQAGEVGTPSNDDQAGQNLEEELQKLLDEMGPTKP